MRQKILVADDEPALQRLVTRTLDTERYEVLKAADGSEALALAILEAPDLVILDIEMPKRDGWEVLKELRVNLHTRMIPVIMLTGKGEVADEVCGLEAGADDYIAKPFVPEDLSARVGSLLRRNRMAVAASPLTGLPGSPTIEREVNRRIQENRAFAFMYADIDHFKPYNDTFGFACGDLVIKETADILMKSLEAEGTGGDFVGHIGGDDFVLIAEPARAPHIAQWIVTTFDRKTSGFYSVADFQRGYIESEDRQGKRQRFPLLSLSIGVVVTDLGKLESYGQVAQLACEMKTFCKAAPEQRLSRFAFDRRQRGDFGRNVAL